MVLATQFNPLYWNTACLIVNSGSLEDNDKSTDYTKTAKALGNIISKGIKVSLIDINKSDFGFVPDAESNNILFGMKALNGVGAPIIEQIIANRPYIGIADFMMRCPLNKSAMISLIKAGAFDNLEQDWAAAMGIPARYLIMAYYLLKVSDLKQKITLQNFNGLIQKDLIPESLEFQKRVFNFNKFLKANAKWGEYYLLNEQCTQFYSSFFDNNELEVISGKTCISQKKWDKIYKTQMEKARDWVKENQQTILQEYNQLLFKENWEYYASGNISAWEMSSLCFYYHDHELKNIDTVKYGLADFNTLPYEPEVEYFFKRGKNEIPIYKTYKIIGTVIGKDDTHSSVSLLTTTGVVNVKLTKEYYAMFARQISEKQEDGKKKVMEKGWFQRGIKLMCTGFRREDTFVCKTYKHTLTHQLYKITSVTNNGTEMELEHERYENAESEKETLYAC